jgi:hypothetical protein
MQARVGERSQSRKRAARAGQRFLGREVTGEDHKRRIERLEDQVKDLRDLLAVK